MTTMSASSMRIASDCACVRKDFQPPCRGTWTPRMCSLSGRRGVAACCNSHSSICGTENMNSYEFRLAADSGRSSSLQLSRHSNDCSSSGKTVSLLAGPLCRTNSQSFHPFASFCSAVPERRTSYFQISRTLRGGTNGRIGRTASWRTLLSFRGRRHTNVFSKFHIGAWSSTARGDAQSLEAAGASGSSSIVENLVGSDSAQLESKQDTKGVFPGGVRRAEVKIPGLVWRIQVLEVLGGNAGSEEFLRTLSSAAAEGLTMVILESGVEGEGGARLYEAACTIKSVLRGRAQLLVAERVDIAAAAGADGVLLSDEGLPAVVARRMMQSSVSEAVVLPLVARAAASAQSAKSATALEGADLLFVHCSDVGDMSSYVSSICKDVSIPVFLDVTGLQTFSKDLVSDPNLSWIVAGASGLVLSAKSVLDDGDVSSSVAAVSSAMTLAIQQRSKSKGIQNLKDSSSVLLREEVDDGYLPKTGQSIDLAIGLDQQAKLILEEERQLLTTMVDFMQEASPEMKEMSLLVDAVKQLDELFLMVIVGEFNSGKSSVINALLGKRFLTEGVLPTTNEITVLHHSGDGNEGRERSERHADGHFLRYVAADLLNQMNIVDTPGTNVILSRQQRLTEEFVPRADLVLFVLSVDRALTESEVTFLRYIRQWGKKIIFILNKSDVIADPNELEEVKVFVRDNAQSLLSVDQAPVYPVSARRAMVAKIAATDETGVVDKELLQQDSYWHSSGFGELEDFIYKFIGGSSDVGAERLRLKLGTPLGIGMALLGATDRQLSAAVVKVDTDLKVLTQIVEQLDEYQQAIEAEATTQRQRTTEVIGAAKSRAGKFVDTIVRLSNIDAMIQYLLGSDGVQSMPVSRAFDKQVIGSAKSDVRVMLEEHGGWLVSNAVRQMNLCGELVRSRWPDVGSEPKPGSTELSAILESYNQKLQTTDCESIGMLEEFDIRAAEILLEQEIREVFLGTFGGLGVAGISASVLTSVLPNTAEDLVALSVCGLGGFVGVWNLPNRRQDVKNKINKVADGIARKLSQAMETNMQKNLDQLKADVRLLTAPYRSAAEAERDRLIALQSQLELLERELRGLGLKVQNLGT